VLDGDMMEAGERQELDRHLEGCPACAEAQAELRTIQVALNELPCPEMPEDVFEEVLQRTSRRPDHTSRFRRWGLDWRAAAAAAAIAVLAWTFWPIGTQQPTDEEIERAAREARFVLGLAGNALDRTGKAAEEVLAGEVSSALQRMPIRLPSSAKPGQREL